MKHSFGFLALASVLLIGAGCTQSTQLSSLPDTSNTVPFSQLEMNILQADEEYSEIRYTHESGDCLDEGMFEQFSYMEDEELGYFIVQSADGEYRDTWAVASSFNELSFTSVPLASGSAECEIQIDQGDDSGELTCTVEDNVVCSSDYSAVAIPR